MKYIPGLYRPEYLYKEDQIVVTSGRLTCHAQDDSVMIFGKKSISLASKGTVNFDVTQAVVINSPTILLGLDADQQVLLGNKTIDMLTELIDKIQGLSLALQQLSESNLAGSIIVIQNQSSALARSCADIRPNLLNLLSTVTYTK